MKQNCFVCKVVGALVILGALNWGLVAFHHDLVTHFLGDMTRAARAVYLLIGLAGAIKLVTCFKDCPACKKS